MTENANHEMMDILIEKEKEMEVIIGKANSHAERISKDAEIKASKLLEIVTKEIDDESKALVEKFEEEIRAGSQRLEEDIQSIKAKLKQDFQDGLAKGIKIIKDNLT